MSEDINTNIPIDGNVSQYTNNDEFIISSGANFYDEVSFYKPIKIEYSGYVFDSDGKNLMFKGDFDGHFIGSGQGKFNGTFDGTFDGSFHGDAFLNEDSNISKPLYDDEFIQALVKDYFYTHFIEWVTLG